MGNAPFTFRQKLTDRETLRRADALVAKMRQACNPLPEKERTQRLKRAETDKVYFLQTYMPHYFSAPFAEMHYALLSAVDEPGVTIYRIPRGWGKTSLSQGLAVWMALFGKKHFQEFIGKSGDMGSELLMAVLLELEENTRIQQDFGDVRSPIWSGDSGYRLKNGCWLQEIGRGMPVRGRKKGQYRPDMIWADDIEDEVLVRSAKRVKDLLRWWLRAVLPSLAEDGTAVWLCTSLAQKSPSSRLLDPSWCAEENSEPPVCKRLSFKAKNDDGESTWPWAWPNDRLAAKEAEIGRTAFNQEYLHKSQSAGGMFDAAWFQYYKEEDLPKEGLATVSACDPSVKSKDGSDMKVVIVLARHLPTDRYFVRHAWARVDTVEPMLGQMFECQRRFNPLKCRLEAQGFAILLEKLIRAMEKVFGFKLRYEAFEQKTPKEIRILQLQAPMQRGQFYFIKNQSDQNVLMEQIEYYPADHDDCPDTLQMAYEFLERLNPSGKQGKYHSVGKRTDYRRAM